MKMLGSVMDSTTTVQIRKTTLVKLGKFRDPVMDRNWSDVLERLMNEDSAIYVKMITIDGFVADSAEHDVIFQLGDDPPRYYRYLNGKFESLPELPKIKASVLK